MKNYELEDLKITIEKMNKIKQLHILKILSDNDCEMTVNSNGIFINLIYVKKNIINKILDFINYTNLQKKNLDDVEKKKKKKKFKF